MILADTSIWVDHLRQGDDELARLLEDAAVAIHPFVTGEIACGQLKNRPRVLSLMASLPAVTVARDGEVLQFIERHRLMGRGLGWVDAHLLAAAALSAPLLLWTRDRPLARAAAALGLAY